jgi:DNA-binding transcriptional LysR family regulator
MLESLEALDALSKVGTMRAAGTRLRITQSAVSKRIAALEATTGLTLLERRGRRVVLTGDAQALLDRARPALRELRAALEGGGAGPRAGVLVCGVSESISASWGPAALRSALAAVPGLSLTLHTHRGPAVIDRVAAGEYGLGLIAGAPPNLGAELVSVALMREPMTIVPCGLDPKALPRKGPTPVITIEPRSGTWESLARTCKKLSIEPQMRLESFFAVAQLAAQGFGHGLVPLGVARALGVEERSRLVAGLTRPVQVVGRATTQARPALREVVAALKQARL